MPNVAQAFILDANDIPVSYNGHLVTSKTLAYTGAAHLGAQDATTLFTVTGDVLVAIFAVCTEDLTGASATVEVGIAGNTAALIAQSVATTIDVGEIWYGTNPPTVGVMPGDKILSGTNIIQTIATANVTDGTLTYYCLWVPLTAGASVVAA